MIIAANRFIRGKYWLAMFFIFILRFILSDLFCRADMYVKSAYFSINPNACKPTGSEYLNNIGIRYCYWWGYYPQERFILFSPSVDLSNSIENWPKQVVHDIGAEKSNFNTIVNCSADNSMKIYKSIDDFYYTIVFCQ